MHARIIQSYLTFEIISFIYFSLYIYIKKKDLKEKRLATINTGTGVGPKVNYRWEKIIKTRTIKRENSIYVLKYLQN